MIVALVVGPVIYWVLSPEGRAEIAHYRCMKREEPKAEAIATFVKAKLTKGQSTKADVREFLKAHFPSVLVSESEADIHAGPFWFSFDSGGTMIDVLQEIPCPVL